MKSIILKSLALASLFNPLLLIANDDDTHVPVGTRPKTQAESPNLLSNTPPPEFESEGTEDENCCGFLYDKFPPVYYSSAIHWLIGVSALGDTVELEDGSVWKISSYDSIKALTWFSNDPLTITQNTRWFSQYNYRIINKNTGGSIEASLYLGPVQSGQYTRYIIAIDPTPSAVFLMLSDNSHWEVSSWDQPIFLDWALGDAVIVGYNSGFFSSYENILINVNMNNFLRAKQY